MAHEIEFTDEDFKPANVEGHYVVDDKAGERPKRDLADVSRHNDQLPVAQTINGPGPTQAREELGWVVDGQPAVVKPMLDVKPNYPTYGVGGFAMRPNMTPEQIYRKPLVQEGPDAYDKVKPGAIVPRVEPRPAEYEGIEGPEDLNKSLEPEDLAE